MFQFRLSLKIKIIVCLWILFQLTDSGCYGFSAKTSNSDVRASSLMPMIDHEKVIVGASFIDQSKDVEFEGTNGTYTYQLTYAESFKYRRSNIL